jgi:glucan phosphoethanolaminetransferase (alkaline phosphatase superfamily)
MFSNFPGFNTHLIFSSEAAGVVEVRVCVCVVCVCVMCIMCAARMALLTPLVAVCVLLSRCASAVSVFLFLLQRVLRTSFSAASGTYTTHTHTHTHTHTTQGSSL